MHDVLLASVAPPNSDASVVRFRPTTVVSSWHFSDNQDLSGERPHKRVSRHGAVGAGAAACDPKLLLDTLSGAPCPVELGAALTGGVFLETFSALLRKKAEIVQRPTSTDSAVGAP